MSIHRVADEPYHAVADCAGEGADCTGPVHFGVSTVLDALVDGEVVHLEGIGEDDVWHDSEGVDPVLRPYIHRFCFLPVCYFDNEVDHNTDHKEDNSCYS